jgi:excisionase family DNA binding protein
MTAELLTFNAAADELGVSLRTLRRYMEAGKIQAIQYVERGKVLFDPDEVERFKSGAKTKLQEAPQPRARTVRPHKSKLIPRDEWGRS